MKTTRQRSIASGFTLVELLVVVGIIALLVSILLPALQKARQSANKAACLSNLRQIAQAAVMYSNQYQGWLMPSDMGAGRADGKIVVPYNGSEWLDHVWTITNQSWGVLECPNQLVQRPTTMQPPSPYTYMKREMYPGYGMKVATETIYFNLPGYKSPQRRLKINAFKNSAEKVWFADSGLTRWTNGYNGGALAIERWRPVLQRYWGNALWQSTTAGMMSNRHGPNLKEKTYPNSTNFKTVGGQCNVAFFDGHAATVDAMDYWADTHGSSPTSFDAIWARHWDPDGDGKPGTPNSGRP